MPIHDWTRVDAGIFHHFHTSWVDEDAFGFRQLDRARSPAKQPACLFTVREYAVCMAKEQEARARMPLRKSV